ncbi:MAG TPA: MFS transporter [Gammaproteobacteria bacterium]|nr:MFS transporter [Gammaproteobacteria bacterium]HIL98045.1 MFS transporter [Pseudomonadales bacterium]
MVESTDSEQPQTADNNKESGPQSEIGGRYAKYVLGVLILVYVFNFIDRQILSILAEDIKADIGITDAEIGFLYGTAFAVFYAVFGIPLGKLADTWIRKNLISLGLLFWSVMTALSGTARGFGALATFRIGVGIGEASATPAAFSMLSDYFPPRLRATALAVYSSGVYIGGGIGIFLGGIILDSWASLYPDTSVAPFQLKGWHVAFFAVGIPGILMALWVATLKEPLRGQSDGIVTPTEPHPFRETFKVLAALLPGTNIYELLRNGAGVKGVIINLVGFVVILIVCGLLYRVTESTAQWAALAIGLYASFSWAQNLAYSDPATFGMIFHSKAIMYSVIGFPSIAFVGYGIGFWGPPFFQRVHQVSAAETGIVLGLSTAVGGWMGVTLGGVITDQLREKYARSKFYVGMATVIFCFPVAVGMLMTENLTVAYVLFFFFSITSAMWIGPAASTINDLVMPRMRAISSAFYILMVTFIGLALGPYTIGYLSDTFAASGPDSAEALRQAMIWGTSMLGLALVTLYLASRHVAVDESSKLERARALGEPV